MNFHKRRCDHRMLLARAADLARLALELRTSEDAGRAVAAIADLDGRIVAHLEAEDVDVYGVLMASRDAVLSRRATAAYDEILARPEAFARAADCVLNALMLRIRFEEETLYPAVEFARPPVGADQAA
jgi:hypothetical protein